MNPVGSYYIFIKRNRWYVYHQRYVDGKRKQESVDEKASRDLGFKKEWSVDEAKAHCKQLNKERSLIKEKIRVAAKRVTSLVSLDETLFPQDRVLQFQNLLQLENFGSDEHLKKINSHFNFIQKMCNEIRIQPIEYKENTKRIYKYFIQKKISPNYANRLITLLNRWGKFVSKINGSFFEDVSVPKGRELSAIADAQQTKRGKDTELGVRTESLPLDPDTLKNAKDNLPENQYNWLMLSVWFGLRPEEVDSLKISNQVRIEFNIKTKLTVLHVYQSKLQSIAREKRWKQIPVIFEEQEQCIKIIQSENFKRPLNKIVRKYVGRGITLYGGRKGFVDLMLSKGQQLIDISLWLGHKDISTTWQKYKDKNEIHFVETSETKVKLRKVKK